MNLICCIADLNTTNNSLQKTFVGIFSVGTRLLSLSNYFTSHIVAEQLFLLRHKTKSLLVLYIKVLGYYVGGFPPVQIGQRGSGQELALMLFKWRTWPGNVLLRKIEENGNVFYYKTQKVPKVCKNSV